MSAVILASKVSAVALQVSRRKVSAVILVNKVSAVSLTSPSWTERAVL